MHQTFRFSQSSRKWLELLQEIFQILKCKSWIYKEGKYRSVWILETSTKIDRLAKPTSIGEKISYIRGYFDAEGGMPKSLKSILYFQFCQKNISDLTEVKRYLEDLRVKCGKIHNPSHRIDADYFRFFVSRASHKDFMDIIYSWHPGKAEQIELRMKI